MYSVTARGPTWPTITAGQDPLSVASLRLSTTDLLGTSDGLAMAPYIREPRRIRARYTVSEQDVSRRMRGDRGAVHHPDSDGVGSYRIDLHPSTGGDTCLDLPGCPFEIPLRALVPLRTTDERVKWLLVRTSPVSSLPVVAA